MERVIMELDDGELSYHCSSSLQGVLFTQIASDYADVLHRQQRHPYSQYLRKTKGKTLWCVNALDPEAEKEVLEPLVRDSFSTFTIHQKDRQIHILGKQRETLGMPSLVHDFYRKEPTHVYQLRFSTPTAFKQQGKYVNHMDLRLFYQSLMNKFSFVSAGQELIDEDLLALLCEKTEVLAQRWRTVKFPMESVKIPSFVGDCIIRIRGTDTLAAYAQMLFCFGEYSGVGIKTAMGMGAFQFQGKEGNRTR